MANITIPKEAIEFAQAWEDYYKKHRSKSHYYLTSALETLNYFIDNRSAVRRFDGSAATKIELIECKKTIQEAYNRVIAQRA